MKGLDSRCLDYTNSQLSLFSGIGRVCSTVMRTRGERGPLPISMFSVFEFQRSFSDSNRMRLGLTFVCSNNAVCLGEETDFAVSEDAPAGVKSRAAESWSALSHHESPLPHCHSVQLPVPAGYAGQ